MAREDFGAVSAAPDVAPVRPDEQLDAAAVAAYLRGKLPEADRPLEILQFPGGHANLTYLLRYGDREYVLRRPPLGPIAPRAHDMVREYRALAALGPYYAPAPRVYVLCEDPAVIGAPFFVMERRHGIVVRRTMPDEIPDDPTIRRRIGEAVVDALADLHAVPVAGTAVAALGKPEGFVARQISGWAERWQRAQTEPLPVMEDLAAWLAARIPPALDATVVHNDFKLDNVMLDRDDPGRVVAVLDWDMTTLGDPRIDVGTLLGYWPEATDPPQRLAVAMQPTYLEGFPTRREVVARYATRSGRDLGAIAFFETFALFKLAVVLQQIYVRFVRGQTKDERFAAMGEAVRHLADIASATRTT
ncbi:MAG: phosphotransferase family protein [Polyangiaceae bacterium UTPRO1]|jgi:aminoglycoside phosphotransferase (APT) family kinase protein|nr:MAG: phosphotransferase family protein [Polyangiaceae bacterium UTPRO1]